MKRGSPGLIFHIFLAVGILALTGAFLSWYSLREFKRTAVRTNGKVVNVSLIDNSRWNRRTVAYSPVVAYSDTAGVQHFYMPGQSSNPSGYKVGETIGVYYDPRHPDKAKLDSWREYIGAIMLSGLGSIFFAIGSGYHVVSRLGHKKKT